MFTELNGHPVSFTIPGDRAHTFAIPSDREHLHPKVAKALADVEAAHGAVQTVMREKPNDHAARREANEALAEAVHALYDRAGASAKATREHAAERYEYATRRYARAIGQAQVALQDAATAAQVFDTAAGSHGVGINPASRAKAVMTAHHLSEQIEGLPGLPEVEA
ncbi:hypothetical protein [Streptomyces sp. IBSBF 2435]|uniref:hypothetical protein n=1 Tax=Streptomyces sp. IBSBF 2435 TaxID=2903531 RepID=UPI002FDC24AC